MITGLSHIVYQWSGIKNPPQHIVTVFGLVWCSGLSTQRMNSPPDKENTHTIQSHRPHLSGNWLKSASLKGTQPVSYRPVNMTEQVNYSGAHSSNNRMPTITLQMIRLDV